MQREELNYILQKANRDKLISLYEKIDKEIGVKILTAPISQTLLLPVKDPISGGEFYSGEVLVTSAIVKCGENRGWAMVMDEDSDLAIYVATIDAIFDSGKFSGEIKDLYDETILELENKEAKLNQKVNSTNVKFDLMA